MKYYIKTIVCIFVYNYFYIIYKHKKAVCFPYRKTHGFYKNMVKTLF